LRPTPEKKEEKERVRLALLRGTLRLAAVHGFPSLGLREAAREAGIAPTSFYRHFEDMNELGMALIHDLLEPRLRELADSLQSADPGQGPADELVARTFKFIEEDPELLRFLLAEQHGAFPAFRTALRTRLAALAEAVHAASGPGTPLSAAEASIVLLLDGAGRALDSEPGARQAVAVRLVETMDRLLSNPQNGPGA
jgi:TetR/AcrR family transcriptional regulator, fatty acid biosynthesis regulator